MTLTSSFEKKTEAAIKRFEMEILPMLVGFSGGADSVSMLHYLTRKYGKENVFACHVNHGIRGADADDDEAYCECFCKKHSIKYVSKHVDVIGECGGSSLEETARNLRYGALYNAAKELGARSIALAHNACDNAETIIFNISRGCGISGLGIPRTRDYRGLKIVRPIILCTRDEIIDYINENHLEYVTDKTNEDTSYSRNDIRKNIIPSIERMKNGAVENMTSLTARAMADEDFIDGFASDFVQRNDRYELSALTSLHTSVLSRVLMKLISEVSKKTPEASHISAIISLLNEGQSGSSVDIPGDCVALIADKKLHIIERRVYESLTESKIQEATKLVFQSDFTGLGFSFSPVPINSEDTRVYKAEIPSEYLSSLEVRSRQSGDSYRYGGMTRNLKKLTTHVPFDARGRRPVITHGGKIIWYPGFPVSSDVRAENKTEIYYYETKILR